MSVSGKSKRQLVEDAVREHLTDDGLVVGRVALQEEAPEILTLPEAASLLRINQAALKDAAENTLLPGRRIGDELRFSRAALLSWLSQSEPS